MTHGLSRVAAGRSRVAAVLAVGALALACTSRRPPPEDADGATIYEYQGCYVCHGDAGQGKSLGPALRGLPANWTGDALVLFLADPDAACDADPRLAAQRKKYPAAMANYEGLTDDQRGVLADWLLTL